MFAFPTTCHTYLEIRRHTGALCYLPVRTITRWSHVNNSALHIAKFHACYLRNARQTVRVSSYYLSRYDRGKYIYWKIIVPYERLQIIISVSRLINSAINWRFVSVVRKRRDYISQSNCVRKTTLFYEWAENHYRRLPRTFLMDTPCFMYERWQNNNKALVSLRVGSLSLSPVDICRYSASIRPIRLHWHEIASIM